MDLVGKERVVLDEPRLRTVGQLLVRVLELTDGPKRAAAPLVQPPEHLLALVSLLEQPLLEHDLDVLGRQGRLGPEPPGDLLHLRVECMGPGIDRTHIAVRGHDRHDPTLSRERQLLDECLKGR
ncbi:hypothetical protein DSECCO2_413290 [anaerobic digester metagenome]